jgi:hypothetical protein
VSSSGDELRNSATDTRLVRKWTVSPRRRSIEHQKRESPPCGGLSTFRGDGTCQQMVNGAARIHQPLAVSILCFERLNNLLRVHEIRVIHVSLESQTKPSQCATAIYLAVWLKTRCPLRIALQF